MLLRTCAARLAIRRALVALLVVTLIGPSLARAVDCRSELAEAEQYYRKGKFDEAIALLEGCLGKPDLPQGEKSEAYRLIGLTYIAQDLRDKAKLAVVDLLRLVPEYQCDPLQDPPDPPTFCDLIDELRPVPERILPPPPPRSSWTRWLLIAGGAVIAGGIAALVSAGGDNEPAGNSGTIADPPALPPDRN